MKEIFNYPNPYAESFNVFKNQLISEQKRLRDEISAFDKNQQKILHHIEAHELSEVESVLVVQAIKVLRIQRRKVKVALKQVTEVLKKCDGDLQETSQQTYNFDDDFEKFLTKIIEG